MKADAGRFHTITVSQIGAAQEIFVDFFRLRGVTALRAEMHPGEPFTVTIELIVAEVSFVEPEAK